MILKWVVSLDHIHLLVEYPTKLWINEIVKILKWRSSRILIQEYWELMRGYWWIHMLMNRIFCSNNMKYNRWNYKVVVFRTSQKCL